MSVVPRLIQAIGMGCGLVVSSAIIVAFMYTGMHQCLSMDSHSARLFLINVWESLIQGLLYLVSKALCANLSPGQIVPLMSSSI